MESFQAQITNGKKATLLDLTYLSTFSPQDGFSFVLEGIQGLGSKLNDSKSFLSVLTSVLPPGQPYSQSNFNISTFAYPKLMPQLNSDLDFLQFNQQEEKI